MILYIGKCHFSEKKLTRYCCVLFSSIFQFYCAVFWINSSNICLIRSGKKCKRNMVCVKEQERKMHLFKEYVGKC